MIPYPISRNSEIQIPSENIAIIIVLSEGSSRDNYKIAVDSVECYAKAHGYKFILTTDDGWGCEHLQDKFFRRHCVVSKILPKFEAILFIDADIGVVNPERKLQEYLDDKVDITLYDRHFCPEIMAGSYLARNTNYSIQLLKDFSEYEKELPNSFHGTDNGAIHMFLAERLFPHNSLELEICRRAWKNSQNVADLFSYTACIRAILGASTDYGKVRILRKGTGWARDSWLTSGVWSPDRDFMLHGWKMKNLRGVPDQGPLKVKPMSQFEWYSPFLGDFEMERCGLGNTTWNHNPRLIAPRKAVEYGLRKFEMKIVLKKIKYQSRLYNLISNSPIFKYFQTRFWFIFYY